MMDSGVSNTGSNQRLRKASPEALALMMANNKKNATASPATEDRYSDVLDPERAKNPDQHNCTTETLSTLPISGGEIKLQNIEPEMDTSVALRDAHWYGRHSAIF